MSLILWAEVQRYVSGEDYRKLRYLYEEFVHSIHSRDLHGIMRSADEIVFILRKGGLPPDLIVELHNSLKRRLRNGVIQRGLPQSFYSDISGLLERGLLLGRGIYRRPMQAPKKAKETLQTELDKIEKIEVDESRPVLFFLGAGASKSPPSNVPTVNELLGELWKKSNQMENKPLAKIEKWCGENQIDNIEELLTGVTLADFMIRNRKVHNLLNSVLYPEWGSLKDLSIRDIESVSSFQNMLDTFFSLLVGTMINAQPNPTHEAITDFIGKIKNTNVVTTNYDVCMDQALDKAGIKYSYIIGSQDEQDAMPLVKMHGSINWFYCGNCQHVLMPTIENVRKAIENDVPYSVAGMCPSCNASAKQFIVPPTTYKYLIYPPIVKVWDAGREIFERSKMYIIIGYSFSVADDYIAKMLLKAIREDPSKQLIIVDKSKETIERFKSYVRTHAVKFEEKNIHDLTGSAEGVVPKVVNALLGEKRSKKRKKKASASVPKT